MEPQAFDIGRWQLNERKIRERESVTHYVRNAQDRIAPPPVARRLGRPVANVRDEVTEGKVRGLQVLKGVLQCGALQLPRPLDRRPDTLLHCVHGVENTGD